MNNAKLHITFRNIFMITILVLLLVILGIHMLIGTNSRMVADDFCQAVMTANMGAFEAIKAKLLNWDGRYSYVFIYLLSPYNRIVIPLLPILYIIFWLSGSFVLIKTLLEKINYQNRLVTTLISGLILVSTLTFSDNVFQSFYWKAGSMPYTLPIILFIWFVNFTIFFNKHSRKNLAFWYSAAFIINFVIVGFSPVLGIIQLLILALWTLAEKIFSLSEHSHTFYLLLSALAGTIIGLLIVIFSPGNAIRAANFENTTNLLIIIKNSFGYTFSLITHIFDKYTLLSTSLVAIPLCLSYLANLNKIFANISIKTILIVLAILTVLTLGLIASAFAPGVYGMSQSIPERAIVIPKLLIAIYLFFLGITIGTIIQKITFFNQKLIQFSIISISILTLMLSMWVFGNITIQEYRNLQTYQKYAAAWDEREALIQSSSETNLQVIPLPPSPIGSQRTTTDPEHWINLCVAKYYDIESIVEIP